MDLAPSKGRALVMARAYRTLKPIPDTTAITPHAGGVGALSRRNLLAAGAALAAGASVPAVAAPAPHSDAELIRLADLAVDARRQYCAALPDDDDDSPETQAELDRLSALADDFCRRSAAIPAATDAGKRAKARIVTLANSHNLSCVGDPAFITLESLLDDLMGGEGACAAFDWHVQRRDGAA